MRDAGSPVGRFPTCRHGYFQVTATDVREHLVRPVSLSTRDRATVDPLTDRSPPQRPAPCHPDSLQ
jgi:hypothetical protein